MGRKSILELLLDRMDSEKRPGVAMGPPAAHDAIKATFDTYGREVPEELVALYRRANGIMLGSFRVSSLEEILWPDMDAISVHTWGTGNVDVAIIGRSTDLCPVFFAGHDPPWRFKVAPSVTAWLQTLYEEWVKFGEILDPWDCMQARLAQTRLYSREAAGR